MPTTARPVGRPRLSRTAIIAREWQRAEQRAAAGFGRGYLRKTYNVVDGNDVLLFQISPTLARTGPFYARRRSQRLLFQHCPFATKTDDDTFVSAGDLDKAIVYLLTAGLNVLVSREGHRIHGRTRLHASLEVYQRPDLVHMHRYIAREPADWEALQVTLRPRIRQWMPEHTITLGQLYRLIVADIWRECDSLHRATAWQFNLNDLGNAVLATPGLFLDVKDWVHRKPDGTEIVRRRTGRDSHA